MVVDFVNNPNLLNVAISRAKKRLYVLLSEDLLKQQGSILRDFSNYEEYYCSETKIIQSNVYSVFDLMYEDYAPVLENLNKQLLHISVQKSENIIGTIIYKLCKEGKCGALQFKNNYPLKYIIKPCVFESQEDEKFVNNIHTHCDFVIYNTLNKEIVLAVEVDGPQHNEEPQKSRDARKDKLLTKAGIKILRLPTHSLDCEEKISWALMHK